MDISAITCRINININHAHPYSPILPPFHLKVPVHAGEYVCAHQHEGVAMGIPSSSVKGLG
jgi:hypothetical protein